jgi:hypothetical protein
LAKGSLHGRRDGTTYGTSALPRIRDDHGRLRRRARAVRWHRTPARRDPREQTWLDLATLSAATFKASRTIARDDVTSFLREPFVEGDPRDSEDEHPVQTGGMEQAIGELVTCSRCVGTWVAAGLATTQVLAPRFGRMLTWTLAGAGINDFLQAGFTALTRKANELER